LVDTVSIEHCCQYIYCLYGDASTAWVRARLCKLQKGCTRLATQVIKFTSYLAHVRWFSPGTPVSSTTKTGRYDIAEILLKMALMHEYTITLYDYWTYMKYPGILRLI
jgi:hypothetical protein